MPGKKGDKSLNPVKTIIISNETLLPPFDEPARDILVMNRPLSAHHEDLAARLGAKPLRVADRSGAVEAVSRHCEGSDAVIFDESLFFSPELLSEFIDKSRRRGAGTTQAFLKKGVFTRQLAILQGLPETGDGIAYPLYFCGEGRLEYDNVRAVPIDVDEYFEEGGFPDHMLNKENFRFSVTTRPLMAVNESIHIGLVNMAANFARVARLRKPGPLSAIRALLAMAGAFCLDKSRLKARALRALSVISPKAEIHPTAVIEGSVVGPGAKVGAYAVLRFSVVGAGAFVDDHAGLKFSIIGDGAYIANNNVVFFSTVYPGAFLISGPYQFSVFGRNSAVMNSIPSDYRLDGKTIKVMTSRGIEDSGLRFTGSIIGHDTRIAAGLIIAPGRAIPNGLTLYPDPGRVLGKVDPGINGTGSAWFLRNGKLTNNPRGGDDEK